MEMWIQKITKDVLPAALALLCPCGRRLNAFIAKNPIANPNGGGPFSGKGARGKRQQRDTGCSCISRGGLSASEEEFPLTVYLLFRTHPTFKTPSSSLSALKQYKRNSIQLPVPRFLSSVSFKDPQQQHSEVYSRPGHNQKYYQKLESFVKNFSSSPYLFFGDMPTSVDIKAEESQTTCSPAKRKLSEVSSSSPTGKSPEKKILKKEEKENQETSKMPSSVPSSPMKESNVTNVPSIRSPMKRALFQGREENETVSKLQFAKLSDKAHAPTKGSKFAAGYDLKSAYEYTVPARGSLMIKTDIQVKLPQGTYGRVAPRSGLALKNKIDVGAGVIDQDYRGNVGVILFNLGDDDFHIAEGDRVAQLICEKIEYPEIEEVKTLDETERGEGGFGSTGVKSN